MSHHPTPVATQENDLYIIALHKTYHDLVHSNNSGRPGLVTVNFETVTAASNQTEDAAGGGPRATAMPRCAITAVTRWRSEFLSILVLSAICAKLIIVYYMYLSVEKYHFQVFLKCF